MTTLLRKSEYLYYSSKLTNNHNNIKNTWAIINKVINTNKKEINSLHNPTSIEFNYYFSSIGPTLAKQIINEPSNESIYSTMNENTKESLFLLPTTLTEIQKEISNTKIKYSTDFNDINMYPKQPNALRVNVKYITTFHQCIYYGSNKHFGYNYFIYAIYVLILYIL